MRLRLLPVLAVLLLAPGCQRAYYGAMERLGMEKRDLLVDRVEDARESQGEAKEAFRSALDEFSALVGYEGGELEALYDELDAAYERSRARADDVSERIDAVERVAGDLFDEWEAELDEYENDRLRRQSAGQRRDAMARYDEMLRAMRRAEATMPPVLEALQDQVLFVKHNLNARAIASLEGEVAILQNDVDQLVAEMERSIAEADRFLREMGGRGR